ncbi:TIGR01777 family oxidoreductase [Evansella sp. AB-P1]|uniref:TIGR01777 family oxidoreductase n=1 Tax=Evansella sp. AB-P1 TaxID=3037653 RepID=UPI00241D52A0|nr:TIGR01777 family oxidoreductase [Evansella sp. AB-P1]MDG5786232.1 TIGR01777 family oxidoreductase [Evansella sp. AB-P1]
MKIAIAGGSGFIGSEVTSKLNQLGHEVYILTRKKQKEIGDSNVTYVQWLSNELKPEEELEGIEAFINLAGENLNSGRWTTSKKEEILHSRIDATKEVIRIIKALKKKPSVLINASAIGFYGTSKTETFVEDSPYKGDDFLANVVQQWERAASEASTEGVRVVYTRFGMVLDKNEGALKKMKLPFQLFAGGRLGSGEQWISWVHIEDVVRAIIFCIETPAVHGAVNVTAPNAVRMNEFGKTLANILNRPYWFPTPKFLLRIVLGEMSILVVEGQQVFPKKLEEHQFQFEFKTLTKALENTLKE